MTKAPTPIAAYFVNAAETGFADVPPPVSVEAMSRVVVALDELREAFQKREDELQAIGDKPAIECAAFDLDYIDEAIQHLEVVICGFTGETPRHLWKDC